MQQRRDFLKFMGQTAITLPWLTSMDFAFAESTLPFTPLGPNTRDELSLVKGLNYNVLIKWQDALNGREHFGTHNDFLAFEPLAGKPGEAILFVNHEYLDMVLFHGRPLGSPRSESEMRQEMAAVGNSLVHIKQTKGSWSVVKDSPYNRRISAETMIPFQKGYTILGKDKAMGTLANCAGGQTPWHTFLSCEENYDEFYGDVTYIDRKREFLPSTHVDKFYWYTKFPNPPEHYGWVTETNPLTGDIVKRCALGRFEHESATVVTGRSGRAVVYMGQDRKFGFLFKFVADKKDSLETGTLYAADTVKGRWIPIDIEKSPVLKKHFNNQHDVLTYAYRAGQVVGATPQDRPEDIEVDPLGGSIFISLTNNYDRGNRYGSIFKITEKNGDHEGLEFTSETFMAGSDEIGFACPDNLVFDKKGNLWMTNDVAVHDLHDGKYDKIGNNGLYFIPLHGPYAGKAYRVATAPEGAEFTGPMFSPDNKTLFLSIQHPGEGTTDPKKPTSHWPDGAGHAPKSAVVTIQGPLLDHLTS